MKRKENKRNGKSFFCKKKSETPFGNIVFHGKMHICAKYGNCMMNYALKMAMTMCIWLETHESSYMLSLFVKFFFNICQNSSLSFFLRNSTYKRTPCKRFAFFDIVFIFYYFFSKWVKSYCRWFLRITAGSIESICNTLTLRSLVFGHC